MAASSEQSSPTKIDWDSWARLAFEFSVLAFLPTLCFSRAFNPRVIEIGVISWLFWELRNREGKGNRPWGWIFLGAFALSYLLSSCFSLHPGSSFRDFLSLLHGLVFCMALARMPLSEGFWVRWSVVTVAVLGMIGLDAYTQEAFGKGLLSHQPRYQPGPNSEPRVTGPFSNPNFLFVVAVLLPISWIYPRGNGRQRWLAWGFLAVCFGASSWAVLLSGSRNAFVAWAAVLAVTGWLALRWKGVVLGAILACGFVILSPQAHRMFHRLTKLDSADFSRLSIWRFDWEVWKENPWLGIGPKMFPATLSEQWAHYQPLAEKSRLDISKRVPQHPHNAHIEAFVERGILGGIAWLGLLGRALWLTLRGSMTGETKRRARCIAAVLLVLLLGGMFDFSLGFRVFAYLLLFFCGLAESVGRTELGTERVNSSSGIESKSQRTTS